MTTIADQLKFIDHYIDRFEVYDEGRSDDFVLVRIRPLSMSPKWFVKIIASYRLLALNLKYTVTGDGIIMAVPLAEDIFA